MTAWAVPRSLLVRIIALVNPPLELGLLIYLFYPALALLAYYLLRKSTRGTNRYGPGPEEPVDPASR